MSRGARSGRPGNSGFNRPRLQPPSLDLQPARVPSRTTRDGQARPRRAAAAGPARPPHPTPEQVKNLLEGFCQEPPADEQLAVNCLGQVLFVRVAEIEWLESDNGHVKLHAAKHAHRLRDCFAALVARLPAERFLQINRWTLVNRDCIQGLQRLIFGEYEVVLRNGRRLPLARGYAAELLPAAAEPLASRRTARG